MALGDFFKRVLVYTLQRPLADDLNDLQTRIAETLRLTWMSVFGESYGSTPGLSLLNSAVWQQPRGFYSTSFFAAPDPTATPYGIFLYPGFGFAPTGPSTVTDLAGASGADWETGAAPLLLSAAQTGISVPSVPAPGHSRIDIIEVRANLVADEPATLGIYNPTTRVYDPTVKNRSADWDLYGRTGTVTSPASSTAAISYKIGVDFAGGIAGATEPAVTPGYMKIARINLDGAVAAITDSLIADMRRPIAPSGMLSVAGQVGIPGVIGGLGTELVQELDLPPGVIVRVAFNNSASPPAGESYTAQFFVIGGDITPRTQNIISAVNVRGTAVATAQGTAPRCMIVGAPAVARITAAFQSILAGTDPNWTVINGVVTVPLGTPFATFSAKVMDPNLAALAGTETFSFVYQLSLA